MPSFTAILTIEAPTEPTAQAWRDEVAQSIEDARESQRRRGDADLGELIPGELMDLFRGLRSGLLDMIDGGRLTECDCPDDWWWLRATLDALTESCSRERALVPTIPPLSAPAKRGEYNANTEGAYCRVRHIGFLAKGPKWYYNPRGSDTVYVLDTRTGRVKQLDGAMSAAGRLADIIAQEYPL